MKLLRMSDVFLECVKEGASKLRVRITTRGYFTWANCQFPRDIRVVGRKYKVPASAIQLVSGPRGKYFYRIDKSSIQIVDTIVTTSVTATVKPEHVYDSGDETCVICMDAPKTVVFAPCGHYCSCVSCSTKLDNKCPMCRSVITEIVPRDMIE